MTGQSYDHVTRWNILLDELCTRAGFVDTASLASRFCELSGSGGQKEFDAALRNLNNWRSGRHIPRPRSLRVLERLLAVDEDPELKARWSLLYKQASDTEPDKPPAIAELATQGEPDIRTRRGWFGPEVFCTGLLMFALGLGAGLLINSDWRPWGGPADHAPLVTYTPEVRLAVGERKVIYAERGDCGKLPRDWPPLAAGLPASQLGTFSDGGLARRNSKFCGGITPARAIVFNAKAAGNEEFLIQGDYFNITVTK